MSSLTVIAALMVILPLAAHTYYIRRQGFGGRSIVSTPFLPQGGYPGAMGSSFLGHSNRVMGYSDYDRPDFETFRIAPAMGGRTVVGLGMGRPMMGQMGQRFPMDGTYRTAAGEFTRDGSDLSYDPRY